MTIPPLDRDPATSPAAGNRAASNFATTAARTKPPAGGVGRDPSPPNPNAPAAVPTGNVDYYKRRAEDFERRNPGMSPPAYYMDYGDKYARRFASLGPMDLSPEGLAWRDRALKALQEAVESKRRQDPAGFARLERNPEEFKKFAYDSHVNAYIQSGLFKLSAQDLAVIAMTPDIKDVLTQDGMKGWKDTISQLRPMDAVHITEATVIDGTQGVARVAYEGAKKILHSPIISGPWQKLPWHL